MADITMCTGDGCLIAEYCYRHNAIPEPRWQSYFAEPPYKDYNCREFIEYTIEVNE